MSWCSRSRSTNSRRAFQHGSGSSTRSPRGRGAGPAGSRADGRRRPRVGGTHDRPAAAHRRPAHPSPARRDAGATRRSRRGRRADPRPVHRRRPDRRRGVQPIVGRVPARGPRTGSSSTDPGAAAPRGRPVGHRRGARGPRRRPRGRDREAARRQAAPVDPRAPARGAVPPPGGHARPQGLPARACVPRWSRRPCAPRAPRSTSSSAPRSRPSPGLVRLSLRTAHRPALSSLVRVSENAEPASAETLPRPGTRGGP